MKKLFFTLIAFGFYANAFATIRRVNNNPGVVTNSAGPAFVYNNFLAAHTAASSTVTDTIYLEPSDINYGFLTIQKKIVLIGPGYLLDKNPNTPFDKRLAMVSAINLFGTTGGATVPTGTVIYGISVQNDNGIYGAISIGLSSSGNGVTTDITVTNSIFNSISRGTFGGSFVTLKKCFITGDITILGSNSLISNNIILGSVAGTANNIIKNNIIYGGLTSGNASCYNNIVFPEISPSLNFPNESNVYNNVCVGCTSTPSFNNFFTTAANTIFQAAEPRILDDLRDDKFILATTSPAKNKGVGGIDCGAFAGPDPYVLSGIPPIPMITAFTQGAPTGGNIPITISIKRN
jgi:hypothetical protein